LDELKVKALSDYWLNVIQVVPDSLITKHIKFEIDENNEFIETNILIDLLKIVVINRYNNANHQLDI